MAYTLSNKGTELIKELKRSDWIPKYNEDGVNTVLEEMEKLVGDTVTVLQGMMDVDSEMPAEGEEHENIEKQELINGYNIMLNIHHCTFYHEKRCLFAYLKHRLDKIRDYRWEKGSILSDDTKALLSKGEIEYFKKYDQVLSTYMQRTGFDLTANMFPPHSIFVEVVATQDYGEIVTPSGTVNISFENRKYVRLTILGKEQYSLLAIIGYRVFNSSGSVNCKEVKLKFVLYLESLFSNII